MVNLTFYGGVNEIGGNKILLEDRDTKIFLDFGMSFGRRGQFFEEFLRPRTANGIGDFLTIMAFNTNRVPGYKLKFCPDFFLVRDTHRIDTFYYAFYPVG